MPGLDALGILEPDPPVRMTITRSRRRCAASCPAAQSELVAAIRGSGRRASGLPTPRMLGFQRRSVGPATRSLARHVPIFPPLRLGQQLARLLGGHALGHRYRSGRRRSRGTPVARSTSMIRFDGIAAPLADRLLGDPSAVRRQPVRQLADGAAGADRLGEADVISDAMWSHGQRL